MIMTPKMWCIHKRIESLEWLVKCDPDDYMLQFELDELKEEFNKLGRIEKLGLKIVIGGLHSSKSSTASSRQIS